MSILSATPGREGTNGPSFATDAIFGRYAPHLAAQGPCGYSRLLSHPRTSRERLIAFQERRLRQLVRHAYDNVPYYRRLFDEAGIEPRDIRGLADLERIPVTTKAALQSLGRSEMLTSGMSAARLIARQTNGSTGVPSLEWMHQYQVRQERQDRVPMRIVPLRQPAPADFAELRRVLEELLGPLVEVNLEFVDDIPEESNGKFRIYRSFVESEYG
jgi:hypothetical protein